MASAEEELIPVDQPSSAPIGCCAGAGWRMPWRYVIVLVLSSMFSFGTHVAYKSLSGISTFLEETLATDSVGYGVLNSAVSWPALACTPFIAGVLIDAYPTRLTGAGLSLFVLLGHLFFSLSVHAGSFGGAVAGRTVFGAGEGSLPIVQGAICVQWFRARGHCSMCEDRCSVSVVPLPATHLAS